MNEPEATWESQPNNRQGGTGTMHQNQPQPSKRHYLGPSWWGVIAAIAVIVIVSIQL